MDGLDEDARLHILEQVAERAVLEHLEHIVVAVVDGERDDLRLALRGLQLLRDLEAAESRHVEVEQQDVRLQDERAGERLLTVLGLADHLEVILEVQDTLDALAQECVIVRDENLDSHISISPL